MREIVVDGETWERKIGNRDNFTIGFAEEVKEMADRTRAGTPIKFIIYYVSSEGNVGICEVEANHAEHAILIFRELKVNVRCIMEVSIADQD